MFCRECGAEVDNNASFCGSCGTKIFRPEAKAESNVKVCPQCRHINVARADFCASCGSPLGGGTTVREEPQVAPATPIPVVPDRKEPQAAPVATPPVVPANVSSPVPAAEDKKPKREKKHNHGGLKALLIIICILLIIAGIWLVPNGIQAAREGKPVRAPWETAETFAEEEEDDTEVPMDWMDIPPVGADGEEDE
ncbi:MAG: zinc ribbon domain-containing protein [Clostridiales bacterium]|nr:zinc ribbon domain-containing protein [Clostridiales bacterium]